MAEKNCLPTVFNQKRSTDFGKCTSESANESGKANHWLKRKYMMDVARDRILAIDSAIGDDVYVYQNFRGDVRAVTSTTSAIKDVRNYLPTGVAISYDSTGFPEMRYGYQGKEQQITGLQDFVNRAYDPYTGRATSFDPLRTAAGAYGNHSGLGWQDYPLVTPGSQTQSDPEGLLSIAPENATQSPNRRAYVEAYAKTMFDGSSRRVNPALWWQVGVFRVPSGGGGCNPSQKSYIRQAEWQIKGAMESGCLGRTSKKLYSGLRVAMYSDVVFCDASIGCGLATGFPLVFATDSIHHSIALNPLHLELKAGYYKPPAGHEKEIDKSYCTVGSYDKDGHTTPDQRYAGALFHELIHSSMWHIGFASSQEFDHNVIDACKWGCKYPLGISGYLLGSDGNSSLQNPATRCSHNGR